MKRLMLFGVLGVCLVWLPLMRFHTELSDNGKVVSTASSKDGDPPPAMGGTSWYWTPQEWTLTTRYTDVRDYADRPDEQKFSQLIVEWQNPELDALGNICTIRGKLSVADGGRDRKRPINWFQGVTIYMAIVPESKPDWSKGMDQKDTMYQSDVVSRTGAFRLQFDMRESMQDRNREQKYQFGMAVAKHAVTGKEKQTVIWNSRTPVIASSVQSLTVPAAPALSHEMQLINSASGWPFKNPNGVDLIRAVNALHPLGKEKALAVLEKYVEATRNHGFDDQEIVFWIIRVLFEPLLPDDRIPIPAIAVFLDDRNVVGALKWPSNPMAIHEDVPFMLGQRIDMSGQPEPSSSHIAWARRQGVLREQPLTPRKNPMAAADAILESARFSALHEHSRKVATQQIRSQALAMVQSSSTDSRKSTRLNNEEWKAQVRAAADRGVRWDTKRQRFVSERE